MDIVVSSVCVSISEVHVMNYTEENVTAVVEHLKITADKGEAQRISFSIAHHLCGRAISQLLLPLQKMPKPMRGVPCSKTDGRVGVAIGVGKSGVALKQKGVDSLFITRSGGLSMEEVRGVMEILKTIKAKSLVFQGVDADTQAEMLAEESEQG